MGGHYDAKSFYDWMGNGTTPVSNTHAGTHNVPALIENFRHAWNRGIEDGRIARIPKGSAMLVDITSDLDKDWCALEDEASPPSVSGGVAKWLSP